MSPRFALVTSVCLLLLALPGCGPGSDLPPPKLSGDSGDLSHPSSPDSGSVSVADAGPTTGSDAGLEGTDAGHGMLTDAGLEGTDAGHSMPADGGHSGPSDAGQTDAGQRCGVTDPLVPFPEGPHGLFVFQPGAQPPGYVLDNPAICGGNFFVDWKVVDKGPQTNGTAQYDWTSIEAQIAPWANAGKKANLLIEALGFGMTNGVTPAYVLSQIDTVSCTQSGDVPVFWEASFKQLYKAFISQVVKKYGSDPRVGYIRFGLSNGAQTGMYTQLCTSELISMYGLDVTVWEAYVQDMAQFEAALPHTNTIMLALGPYQPTNDFSFPDDEASIAVPLGLGVGNQGLQASDITHYNATPRQPCEGGDWCANFTNPSYVGKAPMYLQPIAASCPDNSCGTGSLTTLLPFARSLNAQIFEIYLGDFGIAYDPTNAQYAQYGASYRALYDDLSTALGRSGP